MAVLQSTAICVFFDNKNIPCRNLKLLIELKNEQTCLREFAYEHVWRQNE